MGSSVVCAGCGAPIPLAQAHAGGACRYCGATVLPHAVGAAGARAAAPPPASTPAARSSSSASTLAAIVVLLVQFAPLFAGVAAGASFHAWDDDVRLYIPAITGFAGVVVLFWRSSGAIVAPSLYATVLGFATASRPYVHPIPTDYGDTFSPTSETGLNWVLPGVLLFALGLGILWHVGGTRLRAHVGTARPRVPTLVGFALGVVLGIAGANEVAWMTRIADAREFVTPDRRVAV